MVVFVSGVAAERVHLGGSGPLGVPVPAGRFRPPCTAGETLLRPPMGVAVGGWTSTGSKRGRSAGAELIH